jgi:hypothetical protein
MTFSKQVSSSPTLTYALSTTPDPLQVSLEQTEDSKADLQIVVTNQTAGPVKIEKIALAIEVGAGPADLTIDTSALKVQTQPSNVWGVKPPKEPAAGRNVYKLGPIGTGTGELASGDSIVVVFNEVPVNQSLGTTKIELTEECKPSAGEGLVSWELSKFPFGFFFQNLTVRDPESKALVSQVGLGNPIELTWEGSVEDVDAYTVLYSTASGEEKASVSEVGKWELKNVRQDTQFVVKVSVGEATHSLSASVAVAQPDLQVSSLKLGGQDLAEELATMGRSLVPKGTVAMWSGPVASIPAGWALCDGNNGTPNLVDRFIIGAGQGGGAPDPGNTGGSPAHTHNASSSVSLAEAGEHTHGVPAAWYSNTASSGGGVTVVDRWGQDVKTARTQGAGNHTHQASASVSVQAASNLPPWFALCFIVKQI